MPESSGGHGRDWWARALGARRDPDASIRWEQVEPCPGVGWTQRLDVTSYGTRLHCVLVEPSDASHQVVVLPFYEVESLLGQPYPRNRTLNAAERQSRAFGVQLVERGVAVLAVPWWCEVEATAAGAEELGLEGRYGMPAAEHLARLGITGYGRAIGDLLSVVDALVELEPDRIINTFGHSLGGKLALGMAALDPRIKAAVIHEPGLGFQHSNWSAPWYLDDRVPADHDLNELLALVAPRPILYVGGGLRPESDAFDGPANHHLASAACRRAGTATWLHVLHHDSGHRPPSHVLQACYAWLLEHGNSPRVNN